MIPHMDLKEMCKTAEQQKTQIRKNGHIFENETPKLKIDFFCLYAKNER